MNPLAHEFFARSALVVAPDLLGCLLVRGHGDQRLVGRIVEVEAYLGAEDAASHAFRGPTARNGVMFGRAGYAYVYFIYGNHYCLNVVTGDEGSAAAVLIRAVEPIAGIEAMRERRGRADGRELTNGPGKLCRAFAIDRAFNGHDLTLGSDLWLASGALPDEAICTSARIGVRGDASALSAPWRFFLAGNRYVSPNPGRKAV